MLFGNVISRVVSRLFIIHAPQAPLVDWRRSAHLIDFSHSLSKFLKNPTFLPPRCGFWRRNGSKLIHFIVSLRILINSIPTWLISDDFRCQEKFYEIVENPQSNQVFRIWSISFKFPKIPSQRPDPRVFTVFKSRSTVLLSELSEALFPSAVKKIMMSILLHPSKY